MINVLILGGGFGGIKCALELEKKLKGVVNITLVDRNSFHLFTPSLYEVASAFGLKKDPFSLKLRRVVSISYQEIFEGKNINFIQAEIFNVNLGDRAVITKGERKINYDYLVIALGSQSSDFGIPGVSEYAYQFKTLNDGIMLYHKMDQMFSEAAKDGRSEPIKILVIGAGLTGIELAAELSNCAKKMSKMHGLRQKPSHIVLFEAAPKILPLVSDSEKLIISKRLTKLGISIMENSQVEKVDSDSVFLKNGQTVEGDLIVWTAGIRPNQILGSINGLPLTDKGKIEVENNLKIKGFKNVFAIGDLAEFIDSKTQKPVPGLAYVASDQGKIVSENISRLVRGKYLKNYNPDYELWIAPVGGKFAAAHLWGGIHFKGLWGWLVRELVDLKYLISILPAGKAFKKFWSQIITFSKND